MTWVMGDKQGSNLKLLAIALSVYVAWVAATYLLEGRINLFLHVDPVGRIAYVTVANIAIGTVVSAFTIRYLLKSRFVKPEQIRLNKSRLRAVVIAIAAIGGLALFMLQNPRTTEPLVVFNTFMQVLPVSIAEVMVCWVLVGSSFESLSKHKGRIASVLAGAAAASVLFGVYHYAHSSPFNQTSMVLFLMLPSIATAVSYFLGRSIYAAIIVQNFMGVVGVMAGLPDLESYRQPMFAVYALSIASISVLIVSAFIIVRNAAKKITHDERTTNDIKRTMPR